IVAPTPSITVISPNGGERWVIGEKHLIELSDQPVKCTEGATDCVVYSIQLIDENRNYAGTIRCGYYTPREAVSQVPTEFEWDTRTVLDCCGAGCQSQEIQPGEYKVRIASRYYPSEIIDQSDNYFSIVAPTPSITVISPNGGEKWVVGNSYDIKWDASNLPDDAEISITLLRDDGVNMSIVSNLPATRREYVWKVTTVGDWGYPCFGKGTKVLMKSGAYKNIEDIDVGEYVVSFDLQEKKFGTSKVVEVIQEKDPVIVINQKLKIVPDQMIYVNGEFKMAKDIKIGDLLLNEKGEIMKIYSLKQNLEERIETYDLVLEGLQNFFAEGYLVHSAPELEKFERVYSVLNPNQSSDPYSYQIMV
ncbi:hypothetical protein COY43_00740, partial [Candidatus Berkelbacteria bacterium CG_4_10_14_0_8_um_filter_35_9_33_8]